MIKVFKLKKIKVESGDVLKILDKKSLGFTKFGEAYFSLIDFKKIKGWKKHTKMKMNLIVPIGNVEFVFFDQKKNFFKKYKIGEDNYKRIMVEPGIWFAFRGLSKKTNLVLNISNIIHDPKESKNIDLTSIKYSW